MGQLSHLFKSTFPTNPKLRSLLNVEVDNLVDLFHTFTRTSRHSPTFLSLNPPPFRRTSPPTPTPSDSLDLSFVPVTSRYPKTYSLYYINPSSEYVGPFSNPISPYFSPG